MPIDIPALLNADPISWDASWDERDVILYHLGVGAGDPADDAAALRWCYERDLEVLPSFGVIPGFCAIERMVELPGLDVDLHRLLHTDQQLELARPLPTAAVATSTLRPSGVFDLRAGAAVVLETTTEIDGEVVARNTSTLFIAGEGGFGGSGPPRRQRVRTPRTDPDHVVTTATLPQQALLYRLSGDRNPIHVDPAFAADGGFVRPILHGLCTFGMAMRAVVDGLLDGDVAQIASFQARFSGIVLPGQILTHRLWRTDDGIVVETAGADEVVLKQALVGLR